MIFYYVYDILIEEISQLYKVKKINNYFSEEEVVKEKLYAVLLKDKIVK